MSTVTKDGEAEENIPSSRYMSARRTLEKDIYDDLDKGLVDVQSTCEHAAHQVLKYGDCTGDVRNISRRMTEIMALANRELQQVKSEDSEVFKAVEDESRGHSCRPLSMRKDLTSRSHRSDIKDGNLTVAKDITRVRIAMCGDTLDCWKEGVLC